MRIPIAWTCLTLVASFTLHAAPKPLAEVADSIAKNLPAGCIVTGEFRDNKTTFHLAGKGIPDLAPESHLFEIGSISKVFTGLLLAQAVIDKKLTLSTALRDLLGPGFTFADPNVAAITLEQLSTHTSGLPRLPSNIGPNPDASHDPYAAYDRAALHTFLRFAKIPGPAPHPSSYSNLGAGLLGDLLASLNDSTWEQLIINRITQPLGMSDTRVTLDDAAQKRLAPPFEGTQSGTNWHFQALSGAGALISSASDLIRFGQALLNPDSTPFPDAIRFVLTPRAKFSGESSKIGLGIILSRFLNQPAWEHDGGTGGYRTSFQIQPDSQTVRVILINNDALAPPLLLAAIDPPPPTKSRPEVPITPAAAREYIGVFELDPNSRFTVIQRGDHLWTRLTGQPFFRLFHSGNDRFFLKIAPAELQFERTDGHITHVTLFQNNREQRATKSPQPPPTLIFRPAKDLQPFVGTYDLAPGMTFTISVKNQTLFAQLTGQPDVPVFETKPGRFEYDVVAAALEFKTALDGSVTALILHQNGSHTAPRSKRPSP
jgi:D-alanyl-D-alanine-carboxypeptidase/D-alanyl-D-alanine-endopeptidase